MRVLLYVYAIFVICGSHVGAQAVKPLKPLEPLKPITPMGVYAPPPPLPPVYHPQRLHPGLELMLERHNPNICHCDDCYRMRLAAGIEPMGMSSLRRYQREMRQYQQQLLKPLQVWCRGKWVLMGTCW